MVFPVKEWIEAALVDDVLRKKAYERFAGTAMTLSTKIGHERRELHFSDLGACALEVWARINGKPEIVNWQQTLSKFDAGQFAGAYLAALASVYADSIGVMTMTETPVKYKGLIGSSDLLIEHQHIVDFKQSYYAKPSAPPHERAVYNCLQIAGYSLGHNEDGSEIEDCSIVHYAPALPAFDFKTKARIVPEILKQYDYKVADWKERVDADIARLQACLGPSADCDATEDWRGRNCRYAECPCK